MKGITRRITTDLYMKLMWFVAVGFFVSSHAAMAAPLALNVDVYSPTPPVTNTDSIQLRALSSQDILSDPSWYTETTSLVIDGFDISWELTSYDGPGAGAGVLVPVFNIQTIGPLPAGTYNVTATWGGNAPSWYSGTLPLVGTTQFTVVPEPATLAVLTAGLCLLGIRHRH